MSELIEIKFNDFIKLNRGFDLPDDRIVIGPYPVAASTSIKAYHNQFKVTAPCVTTGRSGSLGSILLIDKNCWPLNTTLYVKDFKGNNPRYVYYFLKMMKLDSFNSGVGVPTLNQNHLHRIKLRIHKKEYQPIIASILSAYDDLIETNNKRISILEQMAEQIYREWFVRMRFPGYENAEFEKGIPKGWEVIELYQIAKEVSKNTKSGQHLHDRVYLPLELLGQNKFIPDDHFGHEEAQSSLVLFTKGDFLFGAMRPYQHKINIAPFNGVTRSTCFVIQPKQELFYSYLFLLLFQNSTVEFATLISNGSDRPYAVWNKSFEKMKILKPSDDLLQRFNTLIKPMLEFSANMYFINKNLKQTRDLLLPRLISGKLRVRDIEKSEVQKE